MTPAAWSFALALALAMTIRPRRPMRPLPTRAPRDAIHTDRVTVRENRRFRPGRDGDDPAEVARWCEALARAVRGGASVIVALREVDPPASHVATVASVIRECERTGRFVLRERDGSPHLTLALAVVSATFEHGGPGAEPLDRAAAVLRARSAEQAERRVQSAQARLSAQVMSLLPVSMLILLVTTSASVRTVVATPAGSALVATGGALNLVGWRWMRRIISRAAR